MQVAGIVLHHFSLGFDGQLLFDRLTAHFMGARWHAILGRSGVGKSSLLKAIAQHFPITPEQIRADDQQALAGRMAWMAQDDLLLPWLTVEKNVLLGLKLRGELQTQSAERATAILAEVGLADYAQRYPEQLSGGQRQRVALARTLMEDKPIVLIDEPFSALDVLTRLQVQELFVRLLRDKTVILITHDPLEALRLCQDLWLMQGQPVQLSKIVTLDSATPRSINDAQVLEWQSRLIEQMQQEAEHE